MGHEIYVETSFYDSGYTCSADNAPTQWLNDFLDIFSQFLISLSQLIPLSYVQMTIPNMFQYLSTIFGIFSKGKLLLNFRKNSYNMLIAVLISKFLATSLRHDNGHNSHSVSWHSSLDCGMICEELCIAGKP